MDRAQNLAYYFTRRYFPVIRIIMLDPVIQGLEIIRKEYNNIKEDDWMIILQQSIIPQERLKSFSEGFYNWFHKNNIAALSILLPQFENLIRYLIQDSKDTAVYRNKEKKQEEESFKNNFNNEIIENKLGQDLVFRFKVLLFADGGFNLRNNIEHGLLADEDFSNPKSDYRVLFMLKVVLFLVF